MTAFNVQNGTNAGWRVVKPSGKPWKCSCGVQRGGYLIRCGFCWQEQPNA